VRRRLNLNLNDADKASIEVTAEATGISLTMLVVASVRLFRLMRGYQQSGYQLRLVKKGAQDVVIELLA
jgi:hypothetical protein